MVFGVESCFPGSVSMKLSSLGFGGAAKGE